MAKNSNAARDMSNDSTAPITDAPLFEGGAFEPPKTARKVVSRVAGFWDEESGIPVYGRVCYAREITPTKGPSKGKVKRYFVIELLAATMLAANKDKNQPAKRAEKGEMVAVWGTPGLSDLNRMAGSLVWVKRNPKGEWIDTGKGNPMKTYDIRQEGQGLAVQVLKFEDAAEAAAHGADEGIPVDENGNPLF